MLSLKETKEWLLRNRINQLGELDLTQLDFSDFDGNIYINNMKVKGNLFQDCQTVKGNLNQSYQKVKFDLFQHSQQVNGDLYSHLLNENEVWEPTFSKTASFAVRKRNLILITKQELNEMGYDLIKEDDK